MARAHTGAEDVVLPLRVARPAQNVIDDAAAHGVGEKVVPVGRYAEPEPTRHSYDYKRSSLELNYSQGIVTRNQTDCQLLLRFIKKKILAVRKSRLRWMLQKEDRKRGGMRL